MAGADNNGRIDVKTYKAFCEPIFNEIKKEIDDLRKLFITAVILSSGALIGVAIDIIIHVMTK